MTNKYLMPRWWMEAVGPRVRAWTRGIGFQPYTFDKTIEGETFRFRVATPGGDAWYGRRTGSSSLEMRFVRDKLLNRGDTVLEIGGHHGKDVVLLSRWVGPAGSVITFEPMPDNVAVIRENIELNELENVEVIQAAVGDSTGTTQMRSRSNSAVQPNGKSGIAVPMHTVDEFCEQRGVTPNLLKIDVEGFELAVIAGAKHTLGRCHPALQVELHCDIMGRYGQAAENIWDLVNRDEYEVWIQQTDHHAPVPYVDDKPMKGRLHLFMKPR